MYSSISLLFIYLSIYLFGEYSFIYSLFIYWFGDHLLIIFRWVLWFYALIFVDLVIYTFILMDSVILPINSDGFCDFDGFYDVIHIFWRILWFHSLILMGPVILLIHCYGSRDLMQLFIIYLLAYLTIIYPL